MYEATTQTVYATSVSGYVITALLSIILLGGAFTLKMFFSRVADVKTMANHNNEIVVGRLDSHSNALTATTRGMDVLIAQTTPMISEVNKHTQTISDLDRAVAVLNSTLKDHIAWASSEHANVERDLRGKADRG